MNAWIKDLVSLFIIMILSFSSFGQKKYYTPIRGFNNQILITIDSLSFKAQHLLSQYYVDSVSGKPYTGIAIVKYADKGLDSLELKNGYINGWKKSYSIKNNLLELFYLAFYDQERLLFISNHMTTSKSKKSAFLNYKTNEMYCYMEIIYKPNKILVKQSVSTKKGKDKAKIKYKSVEELETFLKTRILVYPYCKQAGFFGKPEIQ